MSDEVNEIWELYADEGQQSLQAAEEAVLFLKKSPSDKETISSLFRSVHTFKGNSRVMGLAVIESRAHVAEDLIGIVRDEGVPLDNEITDLLLEIIDVLNDMLTKTCESQQDANPENSAELVERLKQKIARCHGIETPEVEQKPTEQIKKSEEKIEIEDDFFAAAKPTKSKKTKTKTEAQVEDSIEIVEYQASAEDILEEVTQTEDSPIYVNELEATEELDELFSNASFVSDTAIIFNPVDLAQDPVYRDLFAMLASETLVEMRQTLEKFNENSQTELLEQAEHINFAAQQLSFFAWEKVLSEFLTASTFQKSDAENVFEQLKNLLLQDFQRELPVELPAYALLEGVTEEIDDLFESASFVSETAIIFNPIDLADDPVYRDMFATLTSETLLEMQQTLNQFDEENSQSELREQAEHINSAAQQLGFLKWEKVLEEFLSASTFEKSDAENVFDQLKNLLLQDFGKKLPAQNESASALLDGVNANNLATPEIANFFDEIKKPLQLVKAVYDSAEFNSPQFIAALEEIKNLAEPLDFVQLVSLIDEFIEPNRHVVLTHQNVQDFLFWLFEALIAIENVIFEGQTRVNSHTQTMLGYLCSKHVFANLLIINNILESIKNRSNVEYNCTRINEALRKIYYACQHYGLETAAQLSMSLMDLFARITNGDMVVDGFMLHIAKSFVSGIELVLSSLESGIAPDMGQIEKLLDDATSAVFVSSGAVVSASMIEARLALPQPFHKILTTESVKIAADDLDANKHFFIVRTDLEQDEELATNFLTWVSSDSVTAISNVTVFEGNRTLFDFLISTNLNPTQFKEVLINLDHSGKSLFVTHVLEDHKTVGDETNRLRQSELAKTSDGLPLANQGQMSCDMLESIGELVTNQAMMRHLLRDLVEEDLAKNIDVKLNAVDGHWTQAKDDVRQYLLLWQDKVEKLIQIEVQTNALMEQLQEEAIAGRMRSAMQLLKPLYPFVESTARQKNRAVNFSTEGDDVSLDFTMLENLKAPLRTLLTFCMTQSIETQEQRVESGKNEQAKLRVVLIENDDHVKIIIEDDGIGIDTQNVARRAAQLGLANQLESIFNPAYGVTFNDEDSENSVDFSKMRDTLQLHGGNIWITNLPTGGLRFTLTMSLTMLLLEGMVVRINAVHYVIPIDAIQRIIRIDKNNLMSVSADESGFMLHLENNDTIPVQFLKGSHQNNQETNDFADEEKQLFVVIGKEEQRVAIKVSELIGQQNVLSRPLQGYLSHIRGVIGCTLLGSSDVGLVLDINAIFDTNSI